MDLDTNKIDDAVLALLLLGATGARAWKGFDGDTMARLYEQGFISDPRAKSPTVVLSEEGLARVKIKFGELFGRQG